MPDGTFVAVVGPSGAGKDTVLKLAAGQLAGREDILFVRRVITRVSDGATEDHDTLTQDAFERSRSSGAFCLSWTAHGLSYGLPASALEEVTRGKTVVANVSRTVFDEALATFGSLTIVEITAEPDVLAGRIAARGRESAGDVLKRLSRAVEVNPPAGASHMRIDNSGPIASATAAFVEALQRESGGR